MDCADAMDDKEIFRQMHCCLLIPDLFPQDLRLPALDALLAHGNPLAEPEGDMESWLCRAFDVERQADWPVAPFSLLADGGVPGSDYWLRVDPVSVRLMRNRLVLFAGNDIAPGAEEASALCAALTRHFSAENLHFSAPHPRRWYLRLPVAPKLHTHPPAQVSGRDIRHFMPGGADSAGFHKLLNEAQMLLHAHPLNEAREAAGLPPINSIWPWGGGILPDAVACPYVRVFADDAPTRGLALKAGAICHALPPDADACLQAGSGDLLVVLDALRSTAREDQLARLEADWFAPLKLALRRGVIRRLSLIAPGASAITLGRLDLLVPAGIGKLWRRYAGGGSKPGA
ncbi:MAG: hypothetical protein WC091_02855 [Sulfuricellaceae bacterium]